MTTIPRARVTDPLTSHQAAASVGNLPDTQFHVYCIVTCAAEPISDQDIYSQYRADIGYISASGCRTRRKELCDVGLIRDSGLRAVTESGRATIRWTTA
jgi:hypothetical protein